MVKFTIHQFKLFLLDLKDCDKLQINFLTSLAKESPSSADVVEIIFNHFDTCPQSERLSCLYLMDSIVKNIGRDYPILFGQRIVSVFASSFRKADKPLKTKLFKLRLSWKAIFPKEMLYTLDVEIQQMDPSWPIIAPPSAKGPSSSCVAKSYVSVPSYIPSKIVVKQNQAVESPRQVSEKNHYLFSSESASVPSYIPSKIVVKQNQAVGSFHQVSEKDHYLFSSESASAPVYIPSKIVVKQNQAVVSPPQVSEKDQYPKRKKFDSVVEKEGKLYEPLKKKSKKDKENTYPECSLFGNEDQDDRLTFKLEKKDIYGEPFYTRELEKPLHPSTEYNLLANDAFKKHIKIEADSIPSYSTCKYNDIQGKSPVMKLEPYSLDFLPAAPEFKSIESSNKCNSAFHNSHQVIEEWTTDCKPLPAKDLVASPLPTWNHLRIPYDMVNYFRNVPPPNLHPYPQVYNQQFNLEQRQRPVYQSFMPELSSSQFRCKLDAKPVLRQEAMSSWGNTSDLKRPVPTKPSSSGKLPETTDVHALFDKLLASGLIPKS